ncbi:MAG: hypothetical protein VYB61_08480 [Verrucomicrobiota bacterium]|nr:hypothetical protein [Verrucomicrobiota bacterium]
MARPVGEELARNPTAISRPKGGWFARIWTQRAGSVAGNLAAPEKICLDHANPFTIWAAGLRQPHGSGQLTVSSNAFTVWTKAGSDAAADPLVSTVAADSGLEPAIDPLPAGVFEEGNAGGKDDHEVISGEDPLQQTGAVEPVGKPTVELPAHCFTIWTSAQALDCQVVHAENSSESSLIGIQCNNAFTLWTDGRYNSKEPTGSVSSGVDSDCIAGEVGEDLPGPVEAEKSSKGKVGNLVAMAALFLLLIVAMFVISAKNKEVSDIKFGALEEKKEMNGKINDLKHDKQELKAVILEEHERSGGLAKELEKLKSDFAAAQEQSAQESAALQKRGDQLALSLEQTRDMLGDSKKQLLRENAAREELENGRKVLMLELKEEKKKLAGMAKDLEDARQTLVELGKLESLMEKKIAETSKALQEAQEKMASDRVRYEQSEKKNAQLAGEVTRLKAKVEDMLKSGQPEKSPSPEKSEPTQPPEAPKKEEGGEKPDKGPINV